MKQISPFFKITYALVGLLFLCSSHSSANNGILTGRKIILTTLGKTPPGDSTNTSKQVSKEQLLAKSYAIKQDKLVVAACPPLFDSTFPTSGGESALPIGTGTSQWSSVGGDYKAGNANTASGDRVLFGTTGLRFVRDNGTVSNVSKGFTSLPANIKVTLKNVYWTDSGSGPTTTGELQVKLGGVTYATINTTNNPATITTYSGTTSTVSSLPAGEASKTDITFTLTNGAVSTANAGFPTYSGEFVLAFQAASSVYYVDDMFLSGVTITSNQTPPTANAGADFTKTCVTNSAGKAIGAAAVGGLAYSWTATAGSTAPTGANPTVNPTATTTYTLTTSDAYGCSSTDSVLVTVNQTVPVANAGSGFTKTCATNASGATIGVAAVGGVTYAWSPTTGLSDPNLPNPNANPTTTTSYTVKATNTSSGCTLTSSAVAVNVDTAAPAAPTLSATTTIANVCPATSVNLNSLVSSATTNLKWYKESTHTTEVTTPTAVTTTGTYYPFNVATSGNGCFSSPTSTGVTATITGCCPTIAPTVN